MSADGCETEVATPTRWGASPSLMLPASTCDTVDLLESYLPYLFTSQLTLDDTIVPLVVKVVAARMSSALCSLVTATPPNSLQPDAVEFDVDADEFVAYVLLYSPSLPKAERVLMMVPALKVVPCVMPDV